MRLNLIRFRSLGKGLLYAGLLFLAACSTNPATGDRQFTAFMSPAQEMKIGAAEHKKIIEQFGLYDDEAIQIYVQRIGDAVTRDTERPDITYKFFVIDSEIVNAFALPGGYIYVSRGLLALANSEAELAAVLAHEAGHITARHSAERYSHGVLANIGASILSIAAENDVVSQAAGLGSELYIKSYSRSQENQADDLGIRYLVRGGYDPRAMTHFLENLQRDSSLQDRLNGRSSPGIGYFSTHPATSERIEKTVFSARVYQAAGRVETQEYLQIIDGLIYGESPKQGYIRGQDFYHTELGFAFSVPNEFKLINKPNAVIATAEYGAVFVFDLAGNPGNQNALDYLTKTWMKGEALTSVETITVNGAPAAVGSFPGRVNNQNVTIQVMAIQWKPGQFARFQIAIPDRTTQSQLNSLKRATYSYRALTETQKRDIRPYRVRVIAAKPGDTAASLGRRQVFNTLQEERFRVLNGLHPGENLIAGQFYKVITD